MNKSDLKFILIILILSLILFLVSRIDNSNSASVYYDNNLILQIDLSKDNVYDVEGYNGNVVIEVKEGKLRVKEEESPLHICSKQGFMKRGSIVCLPNKIVINFDNNELDAIVG